MVSIPILHVLLLSILVVIASGDARSRFLERLNEAIRDDAAVLMAAENEYADYVDRYGKLNAYLAADVGDVKAHYMAYQENKAEIERLNAKATHHDEHYSVNALTDLTAAEKQAMLIPLSSLPSHRRLGWADVDDCITVSSGSLPTDAGSRSDTAMALGSCGSVKSQGRLGSCWAFASTAQIQCNYNEEKNADEVFSEKYATDCTDGSIGTVNRGGLMHKLTEWYDTNGACTSFHKEYDGSDRTEYDGDCGCEDTKTYGQCYALYADNDGDVIAAAATEHAWDFGIALCNSFFSADDTWYGCGADETVKGGHAMTIVGQQNGDKILVRNSWGSFWGMSGQFAGHIWIHKSAWSTAAGNSYGSLPLTRTQFDGDNRESRESEEATDGDIKCGQTLTGTVGSSPDSVTRRFVNDMVQSVTFTNCDSTFDPKMFLINSTGDRIQDQSTNRCDGDDCYDYSVCSAYYRETFTMNDLDVGSYDLFLTPYYHGGDWSMTVQCHGPSSSARAGAEVHRHSHADHDHDHDHHHDHSHDHSHGGHGHEHSPTARPTTSIAEEAAFAVDIDEWTGKDVVILALVAVNLVTMMAAYCWCTRSEARWCGKGKYMKVVVVANEEDTDLEAVALRQ